ncbi:MAG TPA: hypothetical protein VKA34_02575 [Balneolales bacterium]|nr:hypothetical protein [Balneolales bacterium]
MAKKSHDMSTHSSYMKEKMPLVSPGNAVFGAIQEAIDSLNANPNTNWSKVNVEALRQHLIDMYEFTMNVAVIKQNPLPNGNELIVKPSNQRAEVALNHVLTMHPRMLKKEAGWNMTYQKNGNKYTIKVTTQNPKEVEKIRALGYIGILAYGTHHQRHHWMIVNGINPMTKE